MVGRTVACALLRTRESQSMRPEVTVLSQRYEIGSTIAQGAEGQLIDAVKKSTSGHPAAQRQHVVIKKRFIACLEAAEGCNRERIALEKLGVHDNVVNLIEHARTERWQFFVLERMACDLYHVITAGQCCGISEAQTRLVMRDVASGMRYLHANRFTHNDIKPENILISYEADHVTVKQAKLTDFGFCIHHSETDMLINMGHGTAQYMAPEVRLCCQSSQNPRPMYDAAAADVYSLGATLFVALVGRFVPLHVAKLETQMYALPLSAEIRKLTLQMLSNKPADRPTIWAVRLSTGQEVEYSLQGMFGGSEEAEVAQEEDELWQEDKQEDEDQELAIITSSSHRKASDAKDVPCPSPVFDREASPVAK